MKNLKIAAVLIIALLLCSLTAAEAGKVYKPSSYASSTYKGIVFSIGEERHARNLGYQAPADIAAVITQAVPGVPFSTRISVRPTFNSTYFTRHAENFTNSHWANFSYPVYEHPRVPCVFDYECPCEPTAAPTEAPTEVPTTVPTEVPTTEPTEVPTTEPTVEPTIEPPADPCENVTCEAGFHCEGGVCVPDAPPADPCENVTCEEGFHCEGGVCVPDAPPVDPCEGIVCEEGFYCDGGTCVPFELLCPPGYHDDGAGNCIPDEVPTTVPTTSPPCECEKNKDCMSLHNSPCWKCVDGVCVPKDGTDDPNCGRDSEGCLNNVPGSGGEYGGYCYVNGYWVPCCGSG